MVLSCEEVILFCRLISRIMYENVQALVYINRKYLLYKSKVGKDSTTNALNKDLADLDTVGYSCR